MPESKLWLELKTVFPKPTAPIVESAVSAVGDLPGVESWAHHIQQLADAMKVVNWGIPCLFVQEEASFDPLRARLGSAVSAEGAPRVMDLAECEAAGLLMALSSRVECVEPAANERRPDLMTRWPDGSCVEVEVTSADEKQSQRARRDSAKTLSEELAAIGIHHDVFVHVFDFLSDKERSNLVAAASTLGAEECAELAGRWRVQVKAMPARDPKIVFTVGDEPPRPDWFPTKIAIPFTMQGFVAGPEETAPIPWLYVYWGLTTAAYLNPVEKKASRFQGSGLHPFIIATDIGSLPGAQRIYAEELPNYFPIWEDVSGVLVFEFLSDMVSKSFWTWQFFANPTAKRPLSMECLNALKPGCWETGFMLYEQ
jgi:hypothetical protein